MRLKLVVLLVGIFITSGFFIINQHIVSERISKLSECHLVHLPANYHIHTTLRIHQDGKPIQIPENVGIIRDCIHPLHTHDTTGLIHTDYPKPVIFTLGDFFDIQGIIFTDIQIGNVKKADGYNITVVVDRKNLESNYREIKLIDKRKILIKIQSVKK